jgi:hypothetical protein
MLLCTDVVAEDVLAGRCSGRSMDGDGGGRPPSAQLRSASATGQRTADGSMLTHDSILSVPVGI